MFAILVAVLAASPLPHPAASSPGARIPADGRVLTPEGAAFRLPPRLSYSVHEKDGQRVYAATSADSRTLVAVSAALTDADLPCEGGGEGVELDRLKTRQGLRGCLLTAEPEGELAFVAVLVKEGDVLVTVNAISPEDSAARLARSVADSVVVDARRGRAAGGLTRLALPKGVAAMVGCFEQSHGHSSPLSNGFSRVTWKRCFEEDLTFTEEFTALSSQRHQNFLMGVDERESFIGRVDPKTGVWSFDEGVLSMVYEDGRELEREVSFGESSLLVDGVLWERL